MDPETEIYAHLLVPHGVAPDDVMAVTWREFLTYCTRRGVRGEAMVGALEHLALRAQVRALQGRVVELEEVLGNVDADANHWHDEVMRQRETLGRVEHERDLAVIGRKQWKDGFESQEREMAALRKGLAYQKDAAARWREYAEAREVPEPSLAHLRALRALRAELPTKAVGPVDRTSAQRAENTGVVDLVRRDAEMAHRLEAEGSLPSDTYLVGQEAML
jgi:hypothetical protein